jgi:hypothetical protein
MSLKIFDLRKLNSMSKYPSIETYHKLGDRGRLTDEVSVSFEGEPVILTEKIGGTNTRLVFGPKSSDHLIGSREEWLTYSEDYIFNPAQGIVELVHRHVRRNTPLLFQNSVLVLYLESFGGKITAASKQYTGGDSTLTGCRLFDAIAWDTNVMKNVHSLSLQEISDWRDQGWQPFVDEPTLQAIAASHGLEVTPRLLRTQYAKDEVATGIAPPRGLKETWDWLKCTIPTSNVKLAKSAQGSPEGIVIRTPDRRKIAKIRFEDYQRTFK